MSSLEKPKLGTDPVKGWYVYDSHMMGSLLVKEFLYVGYCITSMQRLEKNSSENVQVLKAANRKDLTQAIATEKGIAEWASQSREDKYHDLYSRAFINMWAAFEAGIENIVASYIANDKETAESILKNPKIKHNISDWPWNRETCLKLASRLEKSAGNLKPGYYPKLQNLFSCVGIEIPYQTDVTNYSIDMLEEANEMRNILLHSYGEVRQSDADKFPSLSQWVGKIRPIDKTLFDAYYKSMSDFVILISLAIFNTRHCRNNT